MITNIKTNAGINFRSVSFKTLVRYVSSSSGGKNPKDWEVGSETGNAYEEAANNWEKVQATTAEYFKFITIMANIASKPELEKLSTDSQDLAKQAEDCPAESDRGIIKNESDTILNQSSLLHEAERSLESSANQIYRNLKPSMNRLRDLRDQALEERKKLEQLWNEELDYEEQQQAKQSLEQENQTEEGRLSEEKRKLEVYSEEQGESSKRRRPESSNPQEGEYSKAKQPETCDLHSESSKKESPTDYILGLPKEHNPFDDVGDD